MIASATDAVLQATDFRPRPAHAQDLPSLVDTLVAAFRDDPVMTWLIPDPVHRPRILRAIFEITADVAHPFGGLYTTDPLPAAGAVWIPPGCQPTGEEAEQLAAWYIEAAEDNAERAATVLQLMDERHPEALHDYLFFIGTRPEWQSRGLGSALLADVLGRCDLEARPAYLEATSGGSRDLYLRHGFEVTGEIVLPDGPSMWCMWREPAVGSGTR